MGKLKRKYVIEAWYRDAGHGWALCHGDCYDYTVRFYVFSREEVIRYDRLHGRDFGTVGEARAAISAANGLEERNHDA
jgi:hypothetical protein